jgi:hypothetical protein
VAELTLANFPTLIIEAGFNTSADTSNYWHIGDPTRGAIGTFALGPDQFWVDITQFCESVSTSRGATRYASPIVRYEAGEANLILNNSDRRFDPTNVNSPYYQQAQTFTITTPGPGTGNPPPSSGGSLSAGSGNPITLFGATFGIGVTKDITMVDPAYFRCEEGGIPNPSGRTATWNDTAQGHLIPAHKPQAIDFKPTVLDWVNKTGNYSTDVANLIGILNGMPDIDGQAVGLWHEPYNKPNLDTGKEGNWATMHVNLKADVMSVVNLPANRSHPIQILGCMQGFPSNSIQDLYFNATMLAHSDIIGWDCYQSEQVTRGAAYAFAKGMPYAIPEHGWSVTTPGSDTDISGRMTTDIGLIKALPTTQQPIFDTWFNKNNNDLTGLIKSQAIWKAVCEEVPGQGPGPGPGGGGAITHVGGTPNDSGASSVSSLQLNLPGSAAIGDLAIAYAAQQSSNAWTADHSYALVVTPPTGGNLNLTVFRKVLDATDISDGHVTLSVTGSHHAAGGIEVFRGASGVDVSSGSASASNGNDVIAPSISPNFDHECIVTIHVTASGVGRTWTGWTGSTPGNTGGDGASGAGGVEQALFYLLDQGTHADTGTLDAVDTGAVNTWCAATLALLPGTSNPGQPQTVTFTIPAQTQITPMRALRIRANWNGTIYPIFRGNIDTWGLSYNKADYSQVAVHAYDGVHQLAQTTLPTISPVTDPGEDTGTRVNELLDAAGWPTNDRIIAVGDSLLQSTDMSTGDSWTQILDATESEIGDMFVDADGRMVFRNRRLIFTDPMSTTVQATFGDQAGELDYYDVTVAYDDVTIFNDILAQVLGSANVQEVSDPASILMFRNRTFPAGGTSAQSLVTQTDQDAANWCGYVLHLAKDAELRFDNLTIMPTRDPVNLFPLALGLAYSNRIKVNLTPPGSTGPTDRISLECLVRGMRHDISPSGSWQTVFVLQPGTKFQFWTLGDARFGSVGTNNALSF